MSMPSRSRLTPYLCIALIVIGIGSGAWYLASPRAPAGSRARVTITFRKP
jgi:hypothetical protein